MVLAVPRDSKNAQQNVSRRGKQAETGRRPRGPRASLKQLLPYLFEQRAPLVLALALGIVGAATSLVQPVLLGQVIERVQVSEPLGTLLVLLTVLVIADAVLSGFQHYVLQRMGEGVVLHSRRSLISRILHLPISEFDRRRTGDLVSRVGSDTTLLRAVLTQGFVEAASGLLVFFGALIGMLIIDPALFGITFSVVVVALAIVVVVSARIRPAVARAQQKVGDLAAQLERSISSIRTIRAAGATEREQHATEKEAEEAYRLGLSVAKISALIVPISFLAMQLSFLVVLGLGGYRVATGAISIAQLVMFIVFLFLMIAPLGQAIGAISAVNQALGALGRIQEIVMSETETERDPQLSPAGRLVPLSEAQHEHAPAISFDAVDFVYRSAAPARVDARDLVTAGRGGRGAWRDAEAAPAEIVETPVLHGVSFEVPRGSRVALVGPSGAGKSTILSLIERFYDPDSGTVSLHGADLRSLDRTELRAQLGYVEQDAPVLAGSLRDNLLIGAPDASDAACERVLRAVNLGGLLDRTAMNLANTGEILSSNDEESLPATTDTEANASAGAAPRMSNEQISKALDTQVGERGIMLSGGEKQRLAIARTLLSAPAILLLDESTASLDGVNERLMREALDSVATGRTLLVIAHRLSTVVDSDRIIVLDDGRVVGEGTHEELVENVPLYRELAQHQLLVPED